MKKVLLYSGGLDSFCLSKLYKPDIHLYLSTGTIDNNRELDKLQSSIKKLTIVDISFLQQYELTNKIIPFRNTFFILIAAQYGNIIYLGATAGDTTKDKDYVFQNQISSLLNYFGLDKDKLSIVDYPYKVELPFKELTKTQIVAEYLIANNTVEDLLINSRSCYDGEEKECGLCRACLRKAIALVNNNIDIDSIFTNNPFDNIDEDTHMKMLTRDKESKDYIQALERIKL